MKSLNPFDANRLGCCRHRRYKRDRIHAAGLPWAWGSGGVWRRRVGAGEGVGEARWVGPRKGTRLRLVVVLLELMVMLLLMVLLIDLLLLELLELKLVLVLWLLLLLL